MAMFHRAQKQQAAALAAWQAKQQQYDQADARLRAAAAGDDGLADYGYPVTLARGETLLWLSEASLIEPRRSSGHYEGRTQGVSVHVAKGVEYHLGASRGTFVPGPEVQTPVDRGRVAVTTTRAVFLGQQKTREWLWSKTLGVDSSADNATCLIHVSNRQTVSGVHANTALHLWIALAQALTSHPYDAVRQELAQLSAAHRQQRPALEA